MSDRGLLKQVPNLYQSRLQFLRWGIYVVTEIGTKVFLFTLAFLSIIDILFSYLLFTNTETGSRQLSAVLILVTTLIAYVFSQMNRHSDSGFQNLTSFRTYAIICSIIAFLYIVTSSIPIDVSYVVPKVLEALYIFTITLGFNAPVFLLCAIFDARVKERAGRKGPRYIDDSLDDLEEERRTMDRVPVGTRARVALSAEFDSITKRLVGPHAPTKPCPHCLGQIDFNERIEWLGPTALTCSHCGEVVHIVDLLEDD